MRVEKRKRPKRGGGGRYTKRYEQILAQRKRERAMWLFMWAFLLCWCSIWAIETGLI